MEFQTLEEELQVRVLLHKVAITKAALTKEYIDEQLNRGNIFLPEPFLTREAYDRATRTINEAIEEGKLDSLYNNAWLIIGEKLPDNFSLNIIREE